MYADRLIAQGVINEEAATELVNNYRDALDRGDCVVAEWREMDLTTKDWTKYLSREWCEYESKFDAARFKGLAQKYVNILHSMNYIHASIKFMPTAH